MSKKNRQTGSELFNEYFQSVYQERWESLAQALKLKEKQVARLSFPEHKIKEIKFLENCLWYVPELINPNELKEDGLKRFYIMDPASVVVAKALHIEPGDKVLDMCAAPGGKTLILSESLNAQGELICNELSSNRRDRLKKVIREYIPEDIRPRVSIQGKDGLRFGLVYPDHFDKILLDAPCSGERHLVQTKSELEKWTIKRTKRLSSLQYGLLCSALLALKSQGEIVYSTCSISPMENDEIIEKLLEKKGQNVEVVELPPPSPFAEKTKYGYLHLPDKSEFGPLYFAKLRKK